MAPLGQNNQIVQEASVEAVVIRCGCGDPDGHNGALGPPGPCPSPSAYEQRGTVSYWHRSFFRRLWYRMFGRPL